MSFKNFTTDWNKPAIFTAQTYGTKTTIEIDHSDLDLDEVMDAFQTLIGGMGYHKDSFKQWVLERAAEYQEEEDEKWDDAIASMEQDEERYENLRHSTDDKFEDYQNSDDDLEWPEPNEELKEAKKKYDKALKTLSKKRKPKSVKDIEDEFDLGGNE